MSYTVAERAAMEIGYALNQSHCTGAPIHRITQALLGDASDFGDILDEFVAIVAPLIQKELVGNVERKKKDSLPRGEHVARIKK